ncbi:helix-hairpin-helix domain-containing protein [Streptomyces sp. NBC_00328]|uniref:helix-hairpin-helix domain-containing protein n=1 Tax=Streptomyces sp. NBC_00328 TaxID=2903646 RepID=UPI002E2BBB7E|nr:helix-hairpin-helix domain-containing protein [Streptomyces sp. NBC_00328]
MALRSSSRTATPTSGPGRGPHSDSRSRHRRRDGRTRTRRHEASAAALRLRADALFTEHAQGRRESGNGPPWTDRDAGDVPRANTAAGTGFMADPVRDPWNPRTEAHGRDTVPDPGRTLRAEGWTADRTAPLSTPTASTPTASARTVSAWTASEAPDGGPVPATAGVPASHDPAGEAGVWRDRAGLAVRERLPLWLQSRCGLERRSVAALTVLLVVAAAFAVQHFWAGRTRPVRAPEVVSATAPYGGKHAPGDGPGLESGAPAGVSSAAVGGGVVVVDVGGKVRTPGLQRLPAGSRVEDALRAAGGLRPGTDTDGLNRARILVDGEQIVVGASAAPTGAGPGGSGGSVAFGAAGSAAGAVPSAPIPLNTATVDQFDSLPGVGPVLARHIIDYRTAHGGFRSVDELREVNGIGDRRFADLRHLVRP